MHVYIFKADGAEGIKCRSMCGVGEGSEVLLEDCGQIIGIDISGIQEKLMWMIECIEMEAAYLLGMCIY